MNFFRRHAVKMIALLSAAVGLILLMVWLALPRWIEARLVPDTARRFGLPEVALEVRHLGLTGLDAAGIRIGNALKLDHLTADYQLRQLVRGRIGRIVLSGLTIQAVRDATGIHLEGIGPFSSRAPTSTPTEPPAFRVGRLEVHNGLLVLKQPGATVKLPFSLTAVAEAQDLSRISARLVLFAHSNPVIVMLRADMSHGDLKAVVQADDTPLSLFQALIPSSAKVAVQGRIAARAEAHLSLYPFQLLSLNGGATATDLFIRTPDFELAAADAPNPLNLGLNATGLHDLAVTFSGALNLVRPLPVAIEDLDMAATLATGASGRAELAVAASANLRSGPPWNGQIHGLRLNAAGHLNDKGRPQASMRLEASGRLDNPLPLSLDRFSLAATGGTERIDVAGDFVVSTPEAAMPAGLKILPAAVKGSLSGSMENLAHWQAGLRVVPTETVLNLTADGLKAQITRPQLDIDLSGRHSTLAFDARLASRQGRIRPEGVSIAWPSISANAGGTLNLSDVPGTADVRFALGLPRPTAAIDDMQAGAGKIGIQGRIRPDPGFGLNADLRIEGGSFAWPSKRLKAENISIHLPLRWPAAGAADGNLAVKTLVWQDHAMGHLDAMVRQTEGGVSLSGKLEDLFIEGLALELSGRAALAAAGTTARLDIALPPWSPAAPVDLGTLVPAAAGLNVEGQLAGHASLDLDVGGLHGKARLRLVDANVAAPGQNFRMDGIETDLEIVDLAALRSAPGQVVRFASATLGSVLLSDGEICFQVEAPHQVLLEKGAFSWCGGRVYAEAMRFSPAVDDYALTLFCDRLGLAELLDQVGGLKAEGGGTVNGRIPLHYRDGRLDFNDGFLYSSPGNGGKIRLTGVERLTEGLGPETLEFAQLALASEALKDYDYAWAKVGIDSQGDELALRLQFDGKPAHPLPFVYRKELGRFVRVEADNPGSRFQGISLDVNLRLPLNRILQYGGFMKMME